MRIVGIDLSLTGTGLAEITLQPGELDELAGIQTTVVGSSGKKDDLLEQRFERQTAITERIMDWVKGPMHFTSPVKLPDLVVIESLFSTGQVGGSQIDRSGLWWRVVGSVLCWSVPVVTAAPMQAKKFLTGAGNSDKGAMAMYASKLYPHWDPSTSKNANDEADALALASIGVGLMASDVDWPYPITDYRQKIIDDINTKQQLRREKAA